MLCGIGDEDKKEVLIKKEGTGGKLLVGVDGEEDRLLFDRDVGGHGSGGGVDDKLLCEKVRGGSCLIKFNHLIM